MESCSSSEAGVSLASRIWRWLRILLTVLIIAGLATVSAVVVVKLTLIRPYCTGDSASYLGAARNLIDGRGLTIPWGSPADRPLVHFPPLYPAALAAGGHFGPDPMIVSRWLNSLLLGVNVILVAFAVYGVTRHRLLACTAAVLVAGSSMMLRMHTAVLSEPMFFALLLPALMALHAYVRRPARWLFWLACSATALALLCRWTAAPLVVTGAILLLVFGPGGPLKRIGRAAAFGALSSLPLGIWMLRNLRVAGTATNRTFASHPVSAERVAEGVRTVSRWAVPSFRPGVSEGHSLIPLALLCLGAVFMAIYFGFRRTDEGRGQRLRRLPWAYAVFGVLYCAFVLVSISYFDLMTPLSDRILSPVYLAWLVALLGMWSCAWERGVYAWPVRAIILLAWLIVAVLQVQAGARFVRFERGRTRYSASSWNPWETRVIRGIPKGRVIFSNRPGDFYIYEDMTVRGWPSPTNVWSGRPEPDYQEQLDAAVAELRESEGYLVMLGTSNSPRLASDVLPRGVPLKRIQQNGKVNVFVLQEHAPQRWRVWR